MSAIDLADLHDACTRPDGWAMACESMPGHPIRHYWWYQRPQGERRTDMAFALRGLDPAVLERIDAAAARRGVSRNAYIVEVLTAHVHHDRPAATREAFAHAAALAVDLDDEDVMRAAWS